MKYIVFLFMFLGVVNAQEHKAVFDCSSDDAYFILSRMNLIEKTMLMIENNGDTSKFAITLHGGCVAMVSKAYEDIVDDADVNYIKQARETLTRLSKRENLEIVVCAMSLDANAIDKDEVSPFIRISKNSFIDTISYQNRGYAMMTFK